MTFYQLKVPSFDRYKFAWAELPEKANISHDFPKCPKCGRAIGQHYWLEPFDVLIKQPKRLGDFIGGLISTDLIVSDNFKTKYENSGLSGIEKFTKLNVVKMGTKSLSSYEKPTLWGVKISITNTQVDYSKMNVTWFSKPKENICDLCCPGGGGDGGIYQTYDTIIVKPTTLTDKDLFIPINFVGNIMITEKAKRFIEDNCFTNITLTPDNEANHDIFKVN